MTISSTPFSTKIVAAAALIALASLAHAGTAPKNGTAKVTPQAGTLTRLVIEGATGGGAANGPFKTTDRLSATAIGMTDGKCGIAITSTATNAQPMAFAVEGSHPFPQTVVFENLKVGTQTVTATPTAGPNFPACQGAPITVKFEVVQ